jgi:hypothetical protein
MAQGATVRTHPTVAMRSNAPWRAFTRAIHASRGAPRLVVRASTLRSRRVIATSVGVGVGFGLVVGARYHAGATAEADTKWPTVSYAELIKHTKRDSLWVSYRGGVYDVTDFVSMHPGTQRTLPTCTRTSN